MTPDDAADGLGIADEHRATFLALVDALRTQEARDAEVARLRTELDRIDKVLVKAGFEYPVGLGGVRDMAAKLEMLAKDLEMLAEDAGE